MNMLCRAVLLLLCLAVLLPAQDKQQVRNAEIEILEIAVHRDGRNVTIDAKLKNAGERPVKKLRIFIEFRDTDGKVISTRTGGIDQPVLEPEAEAELHAQVPDSVRAVDIQFRYEDNAGRDLRGINAGPFTIE